MKTKLLLSSIIIFYFFGCKSQTEEPKSSSSEKTADKGAEVKTKKKSTAQSNVIVLDTLFEISELNRSRKIRLYLPPDYESSTKKYPVIYMHDAQNLFDNATSFAGEWGVDESLNHISENKGIDIIVVGIDNGAEKRMNELSPWSHPDFGKAEGEAYVNFIIHDVKPFIDSNYRTLTDKDNTAIMGSSMGGLISHYAIFQYPNVFAKAGIFSPSYWFSDQVFVLTKDKPLDREHKLYLLAGLKEGSEMSENTQKMYDQIIAKDHPKENIRILIDPDGEHNEAFWKKHFPEAVIWLFQ